MMGGAMRCGDDEGVCEEDESDKVGCEHGESTWFPKVVCNFGG